MSLWVFLGFKFKKLWNTVIDRKKWSIHRKCFVVFFIRNGKVLHAKLIKVDFFISFMVDGQLIILNVK